jgi:mono/diheme cytochrome c family protein
MRITKQRVKRTVAAVAIVFIAALMASGNRASATGASAAEPVAVYKAKCASCHAVDGSGNTAAGKAMKLRDLRSAEVQAQSDDQLFNIIAKSKGKMPGYEKSLGADKCKQLVTHIRHLGGK